MNENLIKELDSTVKILGSLPVTHEAQDIIVAAKAKLRKVIAELQRQGNDANK